MPIYPPLSGGNDSNRHLVVEQDFENQTLNAGLLASLRSANRAARAGRSISG